MVRAGAKQRGDWRQAGRCRWRRVPALLCRGATPVAEGDDAGRTRGSPLPIRFRRHQGALRMSLPVVVLAGGLATRLRPVTTTVPKALVEVAGVPFAKHQIELLK